MPINQNDSRLELNEKGEVSAYIGVDATNLFRAIAVRQALQFHQRTNGAMKITRGWTVTKGLAMVTEYTQKKYKRTQIDSAIADMTQWIEAMRAAIPVEQRKA
jgi:hypothetical protein